MDTVKKTIIAAATVVAVLALIAIGIGINHKNRNEIERLQHNLKALTDTVQVMELKNGDLLHEKQLLVLEKSELEQYLDVSKKDINELEKKLRSSIAYIAKLEGTVRTDTITCTDTVYNTPTGDLQVDFAYKDRWTDLKGNTLITDYKTAQTRVTDLVLDVPLTVGITNDYKFFATSENPNVSFSSINGAAIEKQLKPKRWGMGPSVTLGIYGGYDFLHKSAGFGAGAMIGWSIHYDVLQW